VRWWVGSVKIAGNLCSLGCRVTCVVAVVTPSMPYNHPVHPLTHPPSPRASLHHNPVLMWEHQRPGRPHARAQLRKHTHKHTHTHGGMETLGVQRPKHVRMPGTAANKNAISPGPTAAGYIWLVRWRGIEHRDSCLCALLPWAQDLAKARPCAVLFGEQNYADLNQPRQGSVGRSPCRAAGRAGQGHELAKYGHPV
jgi:hypothetical protein